jgi:hypothetical protein
MSTNSECHFIEWGEGSWYYILENYYAPKNAWDWREHASCYGPFSSEEVADDHLRNNHANPGGSCTFYKDEIDNEDEVLKGLIEGATKVRKIRFRY